MELLLPLILLLPLLMITFRSRKQQRTFSEMQSRIAPGQRVVTTAGLHGTITEVDGDTVLLEVADGVELRWAKAGIGQIVETPDSPSALGADLSDEADEQGAAASTQAGVQDADDKIDTVTTARDRRDEV